MFKFYCYLYHKQNIHGKSNFVIQKGVDMKSHGLNKHLVNMREKS